MAYSVANFLYRVYTIFHGKMIDFHCIITAPVVPHGFQDKIPRVVMVIADADWSHQQLIG